MVDELLAQMFVQIDKMSRDELSNLLAIVNGKIRQHAGKPVGAVPTPISSPVAEIASNLDILSTSNLALLKATLVGGLIGIEYGGQPG